MPRSKTVLASLLILAPLLANAAFFGLGTAFNYPDVLQEPSADILRKFTAQQGTIMLWFAALALSAGLMAPISLILHRFGISRLVTWIGVAAAAVQVIGLSRWLLFVPILAKSGDTALFHTLHTILGTVVGETFGYLLTAAWTILLVGELGAVFAGRAFAYLGIISALLILLGVLIPFGVPFADQANFIGYVAWSLWLLVFGVIVLTRDIRAAQQQQRSLFL